MAQASAVNLETGKVCVASCELRVKRQWSLARNSSLATRNFGLFHRLTFSPLTGMMRGSGRPMPIFSVVILTAIPTGLGADGAGAFVKVDGRESLLRSADVFFNRDGIKQIQLVVADDKFEEAKRKFGDHLSFSGAKLIAGPSQWMDQLETAAQKIPAEVTHVIVHDAARPAVAFTDLDVLLAEAEKHPVAVMTTPLRGGIIETEDSGKPIALRSGQRFQNVVTPWACGRTNSWRW